MRVLIKMKPTIQPIKKTKISEDIALQIRDLIASGQLQPGDRLPPERELAEYFGVSRASVREAMRTLELLGLVESKHGDGTFIREGSIEGLAQSLSSILLTRQGVVVEIMDARKMLEPPLAMRAAERASADDLAELEQLLSTQEEKVARGESPVEEDSRFHYALARATGNRVILKLVDAMMELLHESRQHYWQTPERAQRSLAGHRRILKALLAKDPKAAYRSMLDHLEEVETSIRQSE
ncbi:MAG: FadR family transcriptional regulator [Chloroflexi bacterium]|nr:FadR family transcriptional regulator [Chloroflexota bacterium]MCL5074077.1 FadR family transcriptional regulator [Chloroflexota bacterium]